MGYPRTIQALAEYQEAQAAFGASDTALGPKPQRTLDGLLFDVRETFWKECGGKYTRDECLKMSADQVQALVK
jgi:hypothetical protein